MRSPRLKRLLVPVVFVIPGSEFALPVEADCCDGDAKSVRRLLRFIFHLLSIS